MPKIKSLNVLNDGMHAYSSEGLWNKIEQFASYSFNKSHAVEYTIISYWSMWLKVNHPAEFYAASLSVVGEDKLVDIARDAAKNGVYVVPPDINESGMDFEIGYDPKREQTILYTPFNRLKGLSDNTASAIVDARARRKDATGSEKFTSVADFLAFVNKTKVNKRHQEVLNKVGAYSSVEPTGLPARHPDRLRDQTELMPGLVIEDIKADRAIVMSPTIKGGIVSIISEMRKCDKCDLAGGVHPAMSVGKKPKFMVVTDSPNWSEEQASKMFEGKACDYTRIALTNAGLSKHDGYFTSLIKSPKSGSTITAEQINGCFGYLKREIELLKPAVIVALGSSTVRSLVPDVKGGIMDLAGKIVYVPALDASVVFGINPMMISFDPDKQNSLDDTFERVAGLLD